MIECTCGVKQETLRTDSPASATGKQNKQLFRYAEFAGEITDLPCDGHVAALPEIKSTTAIEVGKHFGFRD